jgi:CTP synthase
MLAEGSQVADLYGATVVSERHRHRYEFNSRFVEQYEANGMRCSGTSPDGRLVEFVEMPSHPYFVGTQAHPEFKSRPDRPHPLFKGLIDAASVRAEGREPHILDPNTVDATL